jgi:protein-S-isoprenylcysteine O-methyltransferase Ste14
MSVDRYLLVRAAAIYGAAMLTAAALIWRRPDRPALAGALLAFAWNLPALLIVHVAAAATGWWSYDADGGLLLGMPVDLWLAWALLWGPVPAIAMPRVPLPAIALLAVLVDLVAMPGAAPVVQLGPSWLIGEFVSILVCLVPALLLARWTSTDRHLVPRACLQVMAFTGLLAWLIPLIAIEGSHTPWIDPLTHPVWVISLAVQCLAMPAILGLSAVQEFVTRGRGTPVPFDPPRHIVTTGIYAYVANPMQSSAVLFLILLAMIVGNIWVASAALIAHVYSVGLAGWDEEEDLRARFGAEWTVYRQRVRKWIPRWRPWYGETAIATLYVSAECGVCRQVAAWFEAREVRGLAIVPAEECAVPLMRITYQSADGTYTASGIIAIARALEHIHLGWAVAGFAMRMPVVSNLIQLITDASGGGPRRVTSPYSPRLQAGAVRHKHRQ